MQRRLLLRSAIRNSARNALLCALLLLPQASAAALGTPVFEWQRCPASYCETGWYASPAVSDVDGLASLTAATGAADALGRP